MKLSNCNFLLTVVILILAVSTVHSQCPPVYSYFGEAAENWFGESVSGAGDVNNDGFDDLIVGAYLNDSGGIHAGRAYVYSGQDGALLHTFTGEAAYDHFGGSVSGAGDVNNDGFDDLIVGADWNATGGNEAGQAYVYSGQDGALLHTFTGEAAYDHFGGSVSGAGDVNNDGFDDLIVGAPLSDTAGSNAGRAYVYSGQSGALLYTFTGEPGGHPFGDEFGFSVSTAGDVNNDGFDDLIVGAYLNDAGGNNAGRAYVYSGQSGSLLFTFNGTAVYDRFGESVSGAGDVNNDGFDDLIVGARYNSTGGYNSGQAYVYSGQSGALLYTFTGEAEGDFFGRSVSGADDVNNDGFDDLIVGAYLNDVGGDGAGGAYVYSGQSGALLYTFTGEAEGDFFGFSVSGAGDGNNDGFDDLIVGAFWNDAGGNDAGRAYVYSGYDLSCVGNRGDLNGDGVDANILDLTFLVDYIFRGSGNSGPCSAEGDVNSDGDSANILDLTFLVDYIFRGGAAPGTC